MSILLALRSYIDTERKRMMRMRCHGFPAPLGVMGVLVMTVGLVSQSRYAAAAEAVPADARLGATGPSLQATVERAGAAGLPTHPLVVKIREGLAKGVPAERIATAVDALARGLDEANQFARAHGRGHPAPELLEALAGLHTRGAAWESATPLVTSKLDDVAASRAVDVLSELAQRGYPERPAGRLLRDVANHDPTAIGRVATGLESVRRGLTVSHADAVDTLGANLAVDGVALDAAVAKSLDGREHGGGNGNGNGNGRGNGQGSEHAAAASKKGMAKGAK